MRVMNRMMLIKWVVLAGAVVVTITPSAARADECDDIVTTISRQIDQIVMAKKEGNSPTGICARLGRVLGMTQAIRIVAATCFEEGPKRDALLKSTVETENALEVQNVCSR